MMDPEMPEEFVQWEEHQPFSEHVLNIICDTASSLFIPLEIVTRKNAPKVLWQRIDNVIQILFVSMTYAHRYRR